MNLKPPQDPAMDRPSLIVEEFLNSKVRDNSFNRRNKYPQRNMNMRSQRYRMPLPPTIYKE